MGTVIKLEQCLQCLRLWCPARQWTCPHCTAPPAPRHRPRPRRARQQQPWLFQVTVYGQTAKGWKPKAVVRSVPVAPAAPAVEADFPETKKGFFAQIGEWLESREEPAT